MTKQYLWLVRYGLTEHQLVEGSGPYDSDIHPQTGVEHAKAIANAILQDESSNNNNGSSTRPTVVYSDPFLRCTHTGSIIAETLNCPQRIEEGVTEWLVKSLLVDEKGVMTHPRTAEELKKLFDTIDTSYTSINPVHEGSSIPPPKKGVPYFEETEEALYDRIELTLDLLFEQHTQTNDNICIVSHAPCLQAMALTLEGKKDPALSSFGPWSLGGITRFSRDVDESSTKKEWTCDFYSKTDHMPGDYKDGVKGSWSLPSFIRNGK